MERYNSLNGYLRRRFSRKVYKIALDGGFTCPNRDGTLSSDGCIFCSSGGSGDFAERGEDIKTQIARAKVKIKSKTPENCGYICYFQAFTNTYASCEELRKMFFEAIEEKDIVAISIATRPDCLENDKIELLKELNSIKPVWVELGLQTSNEDTAELINRCYKNECYEDAVRRLKNAGIEIITHVIIGLPGETVNDCVETVKYACQAGSDGIKLQLLHVLKNTRLAQLDYLPLTKEEYFYAVGECLQVIPQNVVIHRLTGDGDKKTLIAPLWSADKHDVLNSMNRYFEEKNIIQGSATGGQN